MDITHTEDGKQYKVVDGRVVEASVAPEALRVEDTELETELNLHDRVTVGKKLGTIVGLVDTVYGKTAAVKLDDGSFTEKLVDDLDRAPIEKTAAVSADGLEVEYDQYLSMPTDTVEEIELKADKARELNLRAKALQTNSKNTLADQILYDRVITATYVDALDLRDAQQRTAAAEENYLESLPHYELSEGIYRGGISRGDASWLGATASEIEPEVVDDASLARRATQIVSNYSREQLEDEELIKQTVRLALEQVDDKDTKVKFAHFLKEARTEQLSQVETMDKTASVKTSKDLDGNDINLDDIPFEAIFG